MCVIIIVCVGVIGIGILYSCIAVSTEYDQKVNDAQQEAFLRQHKK